MKAVFFCFFTLISCYLSADTEIYEFRGKHLVTNYLECSAEALADEKALMQVMLRLWKNAELKSCIRILMFFQDMG